MDRTSVRELLGVLGRRAGLLESVEQGITDKREIESRLGTSRSTVNRGLKELRETGLITTNSIKPELTVFGKIALEEYRRFDDRFSDIVEAKALLQHLPVDADFDIRIIDSAEVVISQEIAPLEPVLRLEDMVEQSAAKSMQGLSPLILPQFVEFIQDQVTNASLSAEFIFESDVLNYLVMYHNTEVRELMQTGRVHIRRLNGPGLSYGLVIIDDVGVWVGIFELGVGVRGAIINSSREAFEWAEEIYSSLKEHSSSINSDDIMLRGSPTQEAVGLTHLKRTLALNRRE